MKEFVEACKKATGVAISVEYLSRRPGDYAEVYSDRSVEANFGESYVGHWL